MKLKRTVLAVIVSSMALTSAVLAANFTDTQGHWAEDIINNLADAGVVHGISDTQFNPDGTVTRAEFLKMAMGAVGIDEAEPRSGECLDLKGTEWYASCVQGALDKGLIPEDMIKDYSVRITESGAVYSGKLNAETPIKREEMAYIAQEMYQYSLGAEETASLKKSVDLMFTDVRMISIWALDGVRQAYVNGLVSGMDDDTFRPQETATRAQSAVIISNLLNK